MPIRLTSRNILPGIVLKIKNPYELDVDSDELNSVVAQSLLAGTKVTYDTFDLFYLSDVLSTNLYFSKCFFDGTNYYLVENDFNLLVYDSEFNLVKRINKNKEIALFSLVDDDVYIVYDDEIMIIDTNTFEIKETINEENDFTIMKYDGQYIWCINGTDDVLEKRNRNLTLLNAYENISGIYDMILVSDYIYLLKEDKIYQFNKTDETVIEYVVSKVYSNMMYFNGNFILNGLSVDIYDNSFNLINTIFEPINSYSFLHKPVFDGRYFYFVAEKTLNSNKLCNIYITDHQFNIKKVFENIENLRQIHFAREGILVLTDKKLFLLKEI